MSTHIKRWILAVLLSLLGWAVVNRFVITITIWNYLLVELVVVITEIIFKLATPEKDKPESPEETTSSGEF